MPAMPGEDENDPAGKGTGPGKDDATGWFALVGIGFEFVAAICVCGAVGFWVDSHLNTFPWLMIGGGVVGFASGLTIIVQAGHKAFKD